MASDIATHIEIRQNRAGQNRAYVEGTRVRVSDIYAFAEIQGMAADRIVEQLPHLSLGQVHAALSYFFDHREQVLQEIREDDQFVRLMRERTGPGPLEFKLGESAALPESAEN
ncbi:MAG: DUF433 domain-containing protein [Bythopirellula sp.]|nr:DUF433 domain-containing protein [Bythopirellula sp.]